MLKEELKIQEGSEYLPVVMAGLVNVIPGFADTCEAAIPEHRATITTLRTDPGCTCRRKFEKYVKANPKPCYDILSKFFNENPSLQESINLNIGYNSWVDVGGRIVEIDNTEEAYANFYEDLHLKRYSYRGIGVSAQGDKIKIYFI